MPLLHDASAGFGDPYIPAKHLSLCQIYDGYKSLKCVIAPSQVDSPTAAPSAGKFVTTANV
jgi:hypothetical protein